MMPSWRCAGSWPTTAPRTVLTASGIIQEQVGVAEDHADLQQHGLGIVFLVMEGNDDRNGRSPGDDRQWATLRIGSGAHYCSRQYAVSSPNEPSYQFLANRWDGPKN